MATIPNQGIRVDVNPAIQRRSRRSRLHESRQDAAESFSLETLDAAHHRLAAARGPDDVGPPLRELIRFLGAARDRVDARRWMEIIELVRRHPVFPIIQQDPFTRRAFLKPRGYSGDAELLDFIYGVEEGWTPPEASTLGGWIFRFTSRSPAPEGVRARRAFIAREIDHTSERVHRPDVLSVAAGHFREALLSRAFKRRALGRVVALDADRRSLDLVQREYGSHGVEVELANIRTMLTDARGLGSFDLVYSLGLFDYLGDATSRRLVRTLFDTVKPNGKLIIANFLPDIHDVGYMEAMMDWHLIYRTRREMIDMTMDLEQRSLGDISIRAEENQNIIFLELTRQ